MRNFVIGFFSIMSFTFAVNTSQAQTEKTALSYMEGISSALHETKDETWQYLKAITRGKGARKVENKRQKLLTELKKAKSEVRRQGNFHTNDSLKNAAISYLDLTYIVLKEDFDKILDMEDIAEQSYDLMEAYLLAKEKANEKLDSSYMELIAADELFASQNNITIVDPEYDKTSKKIMKAGKTLKYYNQVYLIFFKAYKQEAFALEAMSKNDIVGLEQNINAMNTYSEEGLQKLKEIPSFDNDPNLKIAARKMLQFYKEEAEKDFPAQTDFYIKKDNFEKAQKSFESIRKSDRTQKDVDLLTCPI